MAVASVRCHDASVCPGTAKIRSRFNRVNPAARATARLAATSSGAWCRSSSARSPRSKLCAPKLSRSTPAARRPAQWSAVTVAGFASTVNSSTPAKSNRCRRPSISRTISAGGSSVGVPPPKKTVRGATGRSAAHRSASARIRSTNRAIRSGVCRVML